MTRPAFAKYTAEQLWEVGELTARGQSPKDIFEKLDLPCTLRTLERLIKTFHAFDVEELMQFHRFCWSDAYLPGQSGWEDWFRKEPGFTPSVAEYHLRILRQSRKGAYYLTIRQAKWIGRLAALLPSQSDEVLLITGLEIAKLEWAETVRGWSPYLDDMILKLTEGKKG